MKQYGIKIRSGNIIPITPKQYRAIMPTVSRGSGFISVGDTTANVKDITQIADLRQLDKEQLSTKRAWRCKHGVVYRDWERCTCKQYPGMPIPDGAEHLSIAGGKKKQGQKLKSGNI